MRTVKFILPLLLLIPGGCGYRLAGTKANNGAGRVVAVPTFGNRTTSYRIEQRISDAVRREFVRSTRYRVVSGEAGDVLVSGEVVDFSQSPILFTERGRASSYSIAVVIRVIVTDTKTGS